MSAAERRICSGFGLLLAGSAWGLVALACAEQSGGDTQSGVSEAGGSSASTTEVGGAEVGGAEVGGTATGGTGTGGAGTGTGCPTPAEEKFSFFLTSRAALQKESGYSDGFGGDLGGISGADAICQRIAEGSSACQKNKTWHAFLSTPTANAKERIGSGPWYDRVGRLLAQNMTNLLTDRPTGADVAIVNDFPNESGAPNHDPDGTGLVDNHEILTGTGLDGMVYKQSGGGMSFPGGATACGSSNGTWSVEAATCWGWTTKEAKGCPRVGHSWPRQLSGTNWISVFNEGGCLPGGSLADDSANPAGADGTARVGSAGGYGGFYCFAVTGG